MTGAAGFIGFHVCKRLVEDWDVGQVVGLDLFNDYYDPQLKNDRASQLLAVGVQVSLGCGCLSSTVSSALCDSCTEEMCVIVSCCISSC